MSLSPQKRERLSAFLGELPVAVGLKLFAALEADRAAGGKGLPHNEILNGLRRQLVERGAPPQRRPSAKRTFFSPFEDFFITVRTGKKKRAQIARTSLDPIWRVMMTDPALTETAMAAAALDDAYVAGGDVKALERAMFLAAEAGLGRLVARLSENRETRETLQEELGGENALLDLEELRRLIEGVDALKTLRVLVPSHSPALTEEQYYDLRQLFLSVYEQSPSIGASLLLALKGRLESPWRALGVYYHLAQSADERLAAARETVMVLPESLFEDLETMARALERAGSEALDIEAVTARLSLFSDYADGLARQASRSGDNVFLNRIEACRDVAAEAHARFVEQALADLRAVMPVRHAGASSRLVAPRPDFSKLPLPDMVGAAQLAAKFLAAAPADARRLGADAPLSQATRDDAAGKAKVYANDLVAEIRAAEGAERAAARRLLDQVLSVIAPLLESDELGLIRDRAAAAAVTV
ncbi:MAG: hypothetical protein AAFW68_07905 [Pseudomonadota bacterium]